ncbi:MAG: hypothetical protein Q8L47_00910 [bacterium]|nr:hypothetical protein [bacterium]
MPPIVVERTNKKTCTKENPFVPPLKDDEIWMHEDAYDKNPEHEFTTVIFYCPNCGIDILVDMS